MANHGGLLSRSTPRILLLLVALGLGQRPAAAEDPPPKPVRRCPGDMVEVRNFCIDRFEASTVDRSSGEPLSPYYPPSKKVLSQVFDYWIVERDGFGDEAARAFPLPLLPSYQRTRDFSPKAVSRQGVTPQGYLSYHWAKLACENASKRLCKQNEWVTACGGARGRKFPYGDRYEALACNVHRPYHPAFVLHANSSLGHRDPRLNLLVERDLDPLLHPTGTTARCVSSWGADGVHDLVGNMDEWVDGEEGPMFVGGFYARSTTQGCEASVASHAPAYYDYSTGTRCCRDLPP
jgi:hypothetical protein